MVSRLPLTDESGEVRELTATDLRHFKPAAQVLPFGLHEGLVAMNRRACVRGPQKTPIKLSATICLSPQVSLEDQS